MQIEIKGRHGVAVNSELREYVERRFEKIGRQVPEGARLEVELSEEHNPSISQQCVADAVLYLKGVKLRASDTSWEMKHAIHEISDELGRQVERLREKRSHRREAHKLAASRAKVAPSQLLP